MGAGAVTGVGAAMTGVSSTDARPRKKPPTPIVETITAGTSQRTQARVLRFGGSGGRVAADGRVWGYGVERSVFGRYGGGGGGGSWFMTLFVATSVRGLAQRTLGIA